MAKFRFKLEALLKHRRQVEDHAQRVLAKLLRQRMILQAQVQQMQQTISESKRELGRQLVGPVDVDGITRFSHYSGQAALRAQQIVVRLAALEKQIEAQRAALVEAVKARKAAELLRERQYQDWMAAQDRRLNLEIDELATQQFVRGSMQEAVT